MWLYFVSRLWVSSKSKAAEGATQCNVVLAYIFNDTLPSTFMSIFSLSVLCMFLSWLGIVCEWFPPIGWHILVSVSIYEPDVLLRPTWLPLPWALHAACCTLWQTKAELWIYFWTVVKNSFSKQCPPLERHYHRDVTHLRSKAFSIFSVRMDSVLPDELFRIFKTQETGKKNWLICSCASRQIDQPVVVPQWGYLYIRGKISGLCSCGLTLHVLH